MFLRIIKQLKDMAKGSMLMNLTAGKLGSMVFYRSKGEQRIRTYVQKIANPKTVSQMGQRTQLSNLVALYRVMKSVLDKGFANKKVKQSDYNAFTARNLNRVRIYITKEMAKAQGCVVAPYQISDGTIAPIHISGTGVDAVTDLFLGTDFVINTTTKVSELSQALIANNTDIIEGMQLSYVSVVQSQNPQSGYPSCSMNLYKMVISTTSPSLVIGTLPIQAVKVVGGYLAHGAKVADGAFAWILSKKKGDGSLDVSPQTLIVTSEDIYLSYAGEQAKSDAGMSYGETPDPFLNPASKHVGQGGQANQVGSVSIDGQVLKEGFSPAIETLEFATMKISGSNMDTSVMQIAVSSSGVRLTTSQAIAAAKAPGVLMQNLEASPTLVTGDLVSAYSGIKQVVILFDGVIEYQVLAGSSEAPDPTS